MRNAMRVVVSSLFLVLLSATTRVATSRLMAAAIIPHGDFAYDPSLLDAGTPEREAANDVARAARRAGEFLSTRVDSPDVIFLSTPHGIELSNDFGVYLGSHASGYATIGSDLVNSTTKYKVQLPQLNLAPTLSRNLLEKFENANVSGILSFADSEDMPLRWGEVVPLLMIPNVTETASTSRQQQEYIVWSHPLRRYTESPDMVPELVRIGGSLWEWFEESLTNVNVAMIISSDLSHTHRSDGPYGYSNASQLFDDSVGKWAADPCLHSYHLLDRARSLQNDAKSCGYTGLVLLHGVLCHSMNNRQNIFKGTVLANRNATYYGMMAATFERRNVGRTVGGVSY